MYKQLKEDMNTILETTIWMIIEMKKMPKPKVNPSEQFLQQNGLWRKQSLRAGKWVRKTIDLSKKRLMVNFKKIWRGYGRALEHRKKTTFSNYANLRTPLHKRHGKIINENI